MQNNITELKVVNKKSGFSKKAVHFLLDKGIAIIGVVLLFIIMSIISSDFLTVDNLLNVSRQSAVLCIMAVGMTFIIITGGIDLSAGSQIAVSGVIVASLLAAGVPLPFAILLTIAVGGVIGFVIGGIVATQKIPPFIVTLAMMTILSGLAFVITQGSPIIVSNEAFRFLGRGYIGPIPVPILLLAVVSIIGYLLLSQTKFGRYVYAVGDNEEAARLCGINVKKVKMGVYVLGASITALAGVLLASMYFLK